MTVVGCARRLQLFRVLSRAMILRRIGDDFRCAFWFVSAPGGGEHGMGGAVLGLIGEGRGHGELDTAHTGAHQRGKLEELEADGAAGGAGELWARPMRRKALIRT